MPRRRRLLRLALLALLLALAGDQAAQYTVLADGRLRGFFVAPFDPPLFIQPQLDHLERVRRLAAGDPEAAAASTFDAELGWCPRPGASHFGCVFDGSASRLGAQPFPRPKTPGTRRVVAYGGSFTMGMEVGERDTWLAVLDADVPEVEIANQGVAGYGLDQAFLRFQRDGAALAPDEVWFGLMPQAALRVSTHYAPAYYRWTTMSAFKPRFVPGEPDGPRLRLVANPVREPADYVHLLTDQEAFVDAIGETDLWVRRAPLAFAPRGSSWTHWFATTRLAITLHESGGRAREDWLGDPESEVYVVMRELLLAFAEEANAAGARFRVVVVPSRADLVLRRDRGAFWEDLLRDADVDVFDASDALTAAGAIEDEKLWMPGSHYSPAANRVVADALREAWF